MQPVEPIRNDKNLVHDHEDQIEPNVFEAAKEQLITSMNAAKNMLLTREKAFETKLSNAEHFVDTNLKNIQAIIVEFQNTLDKAGAQTWRSHAEAIFKEGKDQAETLKQLSGDLQKTIKETRTRLDHVSTQLVKNMDKSLGALHPNEFQQLIINSSNEIKTISTFALRQVNSMIKWFHWKNLATVVLLCVLATITVGLYIDDEWPWEAHKTVVKQRNAGQALMDSWPHLSQVDQRLVMNNISNNNIA